MKTSKKKLLDNDWQYAYNIGRDEICFGKLIDDKRVNCRFLERTCEIDFIEVPEKYLTTNFIKELNDELKKLEVK